MSHLRGVLVSVVLLSNLVAWGTLLAIVALFRLARLRTSLVVGTMERIVEGWSRMNQALADALVPQRWIINVPANLSPDANYLIIANHQSWLDVPAIHKVLLGRVPFIRFFVKRELLYAPVIGLAAWALDMPLMKRHSRAVREKDPEKAVEDFETTRRTTRRFGTEPGCILNFIEGTRFSAAKHREQSSPWHHLLRPKLGGISTVVGALGERIDGLVDVTVSYPESRRVFWDYVRGRLPWVAVDVELRSVPHHFKSPAVFEDPAVREQFRNWMYEIWDRKDQRISERVNGPNEGLFGI